MGNIIGVQNGTLYDILDDNNGTGNVTVGAASFNITCGFLPNLTVTGDSSRQFWTGRAPTVDRSSPFFGMNFFLPSMACKDVISHAKYYVNGFLAAPNVLGTVFLNLEAADPAFANSPVSKLVSSQEPDVDWNHSVIVRHLGS